jgi:hypothetical protein
MEATANQQTTSQKSGWDFPALRLEGQSPNLECQFRTPRAWHANLRLFDIIWVFAWAIASSTWCITASGRLGATFDEPVYVSRGLEFWRTGSHAGLMRLGTMPLAIDLQTLPLYFYERWHHTELDPVSDLDQLLPWARAATLFFWCLLLVYGWLAGRQLAGPWAGRLAVAFLACEPSLLAHAGLATTDMALTACLVAFCYHFRAGRRASWPRRVGIPSLWLAAAILSKASALVFGPLCMFILALEAALTQRSSGVWALLRRSWPVAAHDCLQIIALGLACTFIYCGSDWRVEPSFVAWAHQLPNSVGSRTMVWSAEHLPIFTNAGDGLVRQIRHNIRGHGTYLLGTVAQRALWYYFPVALTVKTSLPFLVVPLVLIFLRPRSLLIWPILLAIVLLAFSVTCRVQIGIRLVLPLIAFGLIGNASAIAAFGLRSPVAGPKPDMRSRSWLSSVIAVVLASTSLIWTTIAAGRVWPDGLSYTNECWGGTSQGYLVLSDSNYDWGQGLKELARWQRRHQDASLDVWYFGTDPALKTMPVRPLLFHTLPIQAPGDVAGWVKGHYLAASTSLLYGSVHTVLRPDSPERTAFLATQEFLRGRQPSARTTTFVIYDFRD